MPIDLPGVYAAIVTPFDHECHLAPDQFQKLMANLAARGCHGVLLSGTTGESASLSVAERIAVFEAAAHARAGLRLLAGTGAASLEDVVMLTRAAFDTGLDAVVIIPPFFYADPPLIGLVEFYAAAIERAVPSDGAVLLYHNPFISGVGVSLDLIHALKDRFPDQIVGIKDSSRNLDHARTLIQTFPDFCVLVGDDQLLSAVLGAGGGGAITGVANLFPDLLREVYELHSQGQTTSIAQDRLDNAARQLDGLPRIPAIKALLAAGKVIQTSVLRPPLSSLSDSEYAILANRFHLNLELPTHISLGQ